MTAKGTERPLRGHGAGCVQHQLSRRGRRHGGGCWRPDPHRGPTPNGATTLDCPPGGAQAPRRAVAAQPPATHETAVAPRHHGRGHGLRHVCSCRPPRGRGTASPPWDLGQGARRSVTARTKRGPSSSHGKCPAPSCTTTRASGNRAATWRTTSTGLVHIELSRHQQDRRVRRGQPGAGAQRGEGPPARRRRSRRLRRAGACPRRGEPEPPGPTDRRRTGPAPARSRSAHPHRPRPRQPRGGRSTPSTRAGTTAGNFAGQPPLAAARRWRARPPRLHRGRPGPGDEPGRDAARRAGAPGSSPPSGPARRCAAGPGADAGTRRHPPAGRSGSRPGLQVPMSGSCRAGRARSAGGGRPGPPDRPGRHRPAPPPGQAHQHRALTQEAVGQSRAVTGAEEPVPRLLTRLVGSHRARPVGRGGNCGSGSRDGWGDGRG